MKPSPQPNDADGPSSLALAGEWGVTLAALTTLGAVGGYWLGRQLHNSALMVVLILAGIGGGFSLGVWRMLKVTDRYVNAPSARKDSQTAKSEDAKTDGRP